MSVEFTCGDPAGLVGYLYGECDAKERAAVEAHISGCVSCASELTALGATRTALASWTPPDANLGFRITSAQEDSESRGADRARVLRPARWWQRPMPAWAQVAAAILVFAAGVGLGMRSGDQPSGVVALDFPSALRSATAVSSQDLAALEQRLRAEMTALKAPTAAAAEQPVSPGEGAVLQRVRALLAESEERQQRELALRLGQVLRDVDTQRRMDLVRIEQTFGQMEGQTRPELADQRQMLNFLIQRAGFQREQ